MINREKSALPPLCRFIIPRSPRKVRNQPSVATRPHVVSSGRRAVERREFAGEFRRHFRNSKRTNKSVTALPGDVPCWRIFERGVRSGRTCPESAEFLRTSGSRDL